MTLILAAEIPDWLATLPSINASLNGLATVLLVTGFLLIKRGKRDAHRNVMLTAFAVSVVFLVCYLTYHAGLHHYTGERGKPFTGTGAIRVVYFTILISHVILAAVVPFLAVITIYRGLKSDWVRHKKIAKVTFPVWLYVSITGVVIYLMLYHLPLE